MEQLIVWKGRTNTVPVSIAEDISGDLFTSQIRQGKDHASPVIAEWDVDFLTDGTDGELVLTLDDAITGAITLGSGYMDIKRVKSGEPIKVHDELIEVLFKETITV